MKSTPRAFSLCEILYHMRCSKNTHGDILF
nr:MAG TPA: hypothetical protein [Caudoviricetes sp.]